MRDLLRSRRISAAAALLVTVVAAEVDAADRPRSTAPPRVTAVLEDRGGVLGFDVRSVECHARSCLATLVWSSRAVAQEQEPRLIRAPFPSGCVATSRLPEPAGDGHDYVSTLVLDCTLWRPGATGVVAPARPLAPRCNVRELRRLSP